MFQRASIHFALSKQSFKQEQKCSLLTIFSFQVVSLPLGSVSGYLMIYSHFPWFTFIYTSNKFMMSQHFWQLETHRKCVLGLLSARIDELSLSYILTMWLHFLWIQTCASGDYIYLHADISKAFTEAPPFCIFFIYCAFD